MSPTMDLAAVIARRKELADRHDEARDRWKHTDPEFVRVVQEVASGFEAIATEIMAFRDATEIARTQMWLGDALFDLAQSRNRPFEPALAAYRSAEPYVRIADDELFQAKFDANYANILLRANPGPVELGEVITRYERALPLLGVREPRFAAATQAELGRARLLLSQLHTLAAEMENRRRETRAMLEQMAKHPNEKELATVTGLLRELDDAYNDAERTGDFAATLNMMERIREAFQRWMRHATPALPGRLGRIIGTVMKLWAELTGTSLTPQVDTLTRDRGLDLTSELVAAQARLRTAPEADAPSIWREALLPVAAEARRLLSRALVTWAEPTWSISAVPPTSHGVYMTDSSLRDAVAEGARKLGLDLLHPTTGRDLAEARFDAIRCASVVVADVPEERMARAAACYELGIALALGKPIVVFAPRGSRLPFDIDVQPVDYFTDAAGRDAFDDALERALLLPQRASEGGSLTPLLRAARAHFARLPAAVDELERSVELPLQAAGILANIVRQESAETGAPHLVIYAPWARQYPTPGERRLFHVMPFGTDWSASVKQRTAQACASAGVSYRRGDDVADLRVIRSIWNEICLASHILVDLTDFNPNVCLELGVAQVLGKALFVVGQPGTKERLFPMLKNLRVRDYALDTGGYEALLSGFLDEVA